VLKLPRHGVYDILKVKSHKKVGVTELEEDTTITIYDLYPNMAPS
jgi:hypothetical protein